MNQSSWDIRPFELPILKVCTSPLSLWISQARMEQKTLNPCWKARLRRHACAPVLEGASELRGVDGELQLHVEPGEHLHLQQRKSPSDQRHPCVAQQNLRTSMIENISPPALAIACRV